MTDKTTAADVADRYIPRTADAAVRPDYRENMRLLFEGDADARAKGENLDGSPRRETVPALPDNPKKLYGDKKPPLAQLPLVAQVAASLAHFDGDLKYGFRNWRTQPVEVMTYVNAALRHLRLYEEGEEFARDTKVPNLGAVIACCAILLDAAVNGALIDNRSKSPAACDYLHDAEAMIETLKQAQRDREAKR